MDPKLLQEIGLTEGETKVYLALLGLGPSKTGALAAKAGVSSSKVYKILDRLIAKGLVGHVLRGKIKHFSALEPQRILEYLDAKEEQLKEKHQLLVKLLPQLELEQRRAGKQTSAAIYEGLKGIKHFYRNILTELSAGDVYYVLGAGYGFEEVPGLRAFFQNYHTQRAAKKIKVKMLANYDVQKTLVPATQLYSEVRFLPQYLITNMTIVFYRNKAFIFFLTKEPLGFLMVNEEAVKSFGRYFDAFWKIAKKICRTQK